MNITIALAGNPNSGKTTLFNALTGSNQYVGNWPGVTVERKEARFRLRDDEALLVDLPGVYSLSPYSIEEDITRHFIAQHHPDIVLNIVDATSIERNLYFTLQLMELERPMVIALNQMDEVKRRGGFIDAKRLSALLGIPVVPISAKRREGFDELFDAIHQQAHDQIVPMPEKLYDEATRTPCSTSPSTPRIATSCTATTTMPPRRSTATSAAIPTRATSTTRRPPPGWPSRCSSATGILWKTRS